MELKLFDFDKTTLMAIATPTEEQHRVRCKFNITIPHIAFDENCYSGIAYMGYDPKIKDYPISHFFSEVNGKRYIFKRMTDTEFYNSSMSTITDVDTSREG